MIPDIDTGELNLEVFYEDAHGMTVSAQASYQGAWRPGLEPGWFAWRA